MLSNPTPTLIPMRTTLYPLLLLLAAFSLAACDSSDPVDDPDPITVERAEDIPADPTTTNPEGGPPSSTGRYTLFDLSEGEIVLASDEADRSDSTSATWDIGFSATNVIANAAHGGGIQIVTGAFEEVTEAPADGYVAAPAESWYNYAGEPTHLITPVPGRTLVVRTPGGQYAKVRIVSYYRGAPAEPDGTEDEARYYTFEYVVQPDGSRSFEDVE